MLNKGQIIKTERNRSVCYMDTLNGDESRRWGGWAYEVCEERADNQKQCEYCKMSKICQNNKKYYVKCMDLGPGTMTKNSAFYCLRRESYLVYEMTSTYRYLVVPCDRAKVANDACIFYPYKGIGWNEFWDEEDDGLDVESRIMMKEKIFLRLLYGVKEYAEKGYVHRDLKPGNLTLEKKENGEIIPYIVDFDWMYIDQKFERKVRMNNELETAYPGGTEGYSHPLSFRRNERNEVIETPSIRWDFYSVAMIAYSLFEEKAHFNSLEKKWDQKEESNENGKRYWNNDSIGFTLREMSRTENELKNTVALQALRELLQKMMGKNSRYEGQYSCVDDIISDYKNYLKIRYGSDYCQLFEEENEIFRNSQPVYADTKKICIQVVSEFCEERHYVLSKETKISVDVDRQKVMDIAWDESDNVLITVADEQWEWKENQDTLENKSSQVQINIVCC